jgi:hypothetical protein
MRRGSACGGPRHHLVLRAVTGGSHTDGRRLGAGAQHAGRADIAADSPPANPPPDGRQFGILPNRSVGGTGTEPVTSSVVEKRRTSLGSFETPPYGI